MTRAVIRDCSTAYVAANRFMRILALPGSPWIGRKDSMVMQGGNDHARHRALSIIPAGFELAEEREPCGVEYKGAGLLPMCQEPRALLS